MIEPVRRRLRHYRRVWAMDFEYVHDAGEVPEPVCMVAWDLMTGDKVELWRRELRQGCPFDTGPGSLFIVFSGAGDLGCFLALGWPIPARVVDLYPEARQEVFDTGSPARASLLSAARRYGVPVMESADKEASRDLIIFRRFTDADRRRLLDYCAEDVLATGRVFMCMFGTLTRTRAAWNGVLLRGRYTAALARMERTGVPLDVESLSLAQRHWDGIKRRLIARVDSAYGLYVDGAFSAARFERYLRRQSIPWPRLESGALSLADGTFRQAARAHPQLGALRELRHVLAGMRLSDYTIGADGRNRVFLNPYGSVTGRNQPSNSRFIFGSARWSRSFIRPAPGMALAYCDWSAQEIAICAALSRDPALWGAYASGDPYWSFAVDAGLSPPVPYSKSDAAHVRLRKRCKALMLGVGYGMEAAGLAGALGVTLDEARELLLRHRESYRAFWRFVARVQDTGAAGLELRTRFHWVRRLKPGSGLPNPRSLQNWPAQANGAEMMRLAAAMLTEAGVQVCCPVHDAFLIEAPADELADTVAATRRLMMDASELVLGEGYRVRVGADEVRHPARYVDENAGTMFADVMTLARDLEAERACSGPSISSANRAFLGTQP